MPLDQVVNGILHDLGVQAAFYFMGPEDFEQTTGEPITTAFASTTGIAERLTSFYTADP